MEMYCRVYFSLCLLLGFQGARDFSEKLNLHEKLPIYGRFDL